MSAPLYRLAVLASHPIQYQAPLFRAIVNSGQVDLHVFFCSGETAGVHLDPGFGVSFAWDVPLLEGYPYSFLENSSTRPTPGRFLGCINPGIMRALSSGNYDAVLIHGWALATCWLAFIAAARHAIPILLRGETSLLTERTGAKGAARRFLLVQLFHRISAFLAIGTHSRKFYEAYGIPKEKVFLAPYAVDNDFFLAHAARLSGDKRGLREREGIAPDLPVILFCAKFSTVKRPMDLLRAFHGLGQNAGASLVFVGDGQLRGEMEDYIAAHSMKHVHLLGFRNQSELPACYALADVFVLPSGHEPWGLVVNEAMCFGLPVIASDKIGSAPDLVHHNVNGFVFPAGNVESLTGLLARLISCDEERDHMGRESRRIIGSWGINETVRSLVEALAHVTGKTSRNEVAATVSRT